MRLTPLAEAGLEDIWAYTCEQYLGEFVAAFDRLARGEWVGGRAVRGPYWRYLVGFPALFYRETADVLNVTRVRYQRMDVDRHLLRY
ncbi:type II toxin-antitoxin system RelE/ParE family toxin [Burkholderia gladioli]|uniref:type II toxin-antitoxin system RelE/ParE family toxin n=1 Tax=Burkholderia gladioli TaxID=28095 RepID=UPI001FC85DAF|nr:type II toxin-antitoxin system RelE/ParE family toxin [Burkholderia gladioli]MDN7499546.1 type II toxin-antitoxin system RelE/ParE family toxin [Burkholderia gladioli]MDZ4041494.1 type II toxin-antitoxin system RelE/ParE family toxin [Burkholderia gladioli pv. alliicola]